MPIAPVQMPSRPKAPGAGVGLAGLGMQPFRPAPMGGIPSAATMGPPMSEPKGPAGEVPPDSRSPFGPIGAPPATSPPSPGGMPGYRPGPMAPRGPMGLSGMAPVAPAPMAPAMAPQAPLQPDASGVTPPPGTPQPPPPMAPAGPAAVPQGMGAQTPEAPPAAAPPPMAEAGAVGTQSLQTAAAPPPDVMGLSRLRGTPSPATAVPVAPAKPAGGGRTSGGKVVSSDLTMGQVATLGAAGRGDTSGSGMPSGEGGRKTDKDYQQAAIDAGFDVFDESGNLATLPLTPEGIIDSGFLAAIGLGNNPGLSEKLNSLPDLFKQYQTAMAEGNTTAAKQAQNQIINNLKAAKQGGLAVDPEGMFNYYTSGEGAAAWVPPPGTPTQDPPGLEEGTVDPGTGAVDLGDLDLDAAKAGIPDQLLKWINENPEAGKSILDYLGNLQSRDDRQTAIDSLQQGLGGLLANDPTRTAMYDYLEGGPQYALDPATVEKMKTSGREMYGQGLTGLDQQLRAAAGAAGVPTSNLAALSAQGRQALLSNLMAGERSTDIQAAMQNQADRQQYFANLDRAQGSLLGPMAAYQGSLASLIAGAPGLANTGNPLAGLAEFRASQEAMKPGAMGARDWTAIGAQGLGSLLGAVA